jgi:two-component system sensor histidine kinase BaeS
LTLHGELAAGLRPVEGDSEHLRRVVDNLIANALKFTPSGGAISVRLHGSDGEVVLEVEDTGIGVASEHQGLIFDRFYQVDGSTRRTHGGCGLGLALVKEIVQRHGGTVQVWSELGTGSRFTVRLPARSTARSTPSTR